MPEAPRHASRYLASGAAIVALSFVTLAAWRGLDAADPATVANNSTQTQQAPATAVAPAAINGLVTSYAPIVKSVTPGVVTVRVEAKAAPTPTGGQMPDLGELFGRQFRIPQQQPHRERGLGSGVVVKGDGYILTNNHVVDGAEDIKVELPDKRVFNAKLIGADPATDLAVIKIQATNLRTVPLGDSDKVQVGDVVLAVGNPLGIGQTVTMGIVSGKGRTTGGYGDGGFEDFLQTDAPINRGNSGGALVNVQGQLVGINSQILSPSGGSIGLGFAIPVNMARNVMDQLLVDGKVHRAKLGVSLQGMTADLASSLGLPDVKGGLVSSVEPNSAAARAGLKR
jgi:Do/DeqQ family serine protease